MEIAVARKVLSSAAALVAVRAAVENGRSLGKALVAAAVDANGDLLACWRADGALVASVGIAKDKAYTAAAFKSGTAALSNALGPNAALHHGIAIRPGVALFGGGLPILEAGAVVGAVGVSGGSEGDDCACAEAALAALGASDNR